MGGDDHARPLGRIDQLRLDDGRERQVAERSAPVPTLVAALGDLDRGLRVRVEVSEGREPVDAREAVSLAPAALRVEEVVGELARVLGREPERA
jgi:hypothetical protein